MCSTVVEFTLWLLAVTDDGVLDLSICEIKARTAVKCTSERQQLTLETLMNTSWSTLTSLTSYPIKLVNLKKKKEQNNSKNIFQI